MERILVPCDFSAPSREAFKFALAIAVRAKGEVIVLHAAYVPVLYDPGYAGGAPLAYDPSFLSRVEDDTRKGFEKMMQETSQSGVLVTLEIIHDEIISAIKYIADKKEVDLIVMGTSGASGLREVFIGSNTEKVVRFAPVPVLAVHHAPSDIAAIKKILLPTTLALNQISFMDKVKELQQFFDASLEVLFINTASHFKSDRDAKEAMEEFAKHYHLSNYSLHFRNYSHEEDGIIDFATKKNIDLIAMATHARKGLARLFTGSVTEDVVNHIKTAVWTFNRI